MDQPQNDIDYGHQQEKQEEGCRRQVPEGQSGTFDDHVVVGRPQADAQRPAHPHDQSFQGTSPVPDEICSLFKNDADFPMTLNTFLISSRFLLLGTGRSTRN